MKKLYSIFIALTILFLLLPNTTLASYKDVPTTHANYKDIMYLLENNVIEKASHYGINDIVTREEVAVMVAKSVGLDGKQRDTKFSDVKKSDKNSGYIQSAVEAGIINGYSDGTFKPNEKVTRGHMAAFIARAFDLPTGSKTFKDVPFNHTAYEAIKQLVAAGITTGYTDGTFKPNNNLTRGHISAFLARAMRYTHSINYPEIQLEVIGIQDESTFTTQNFSFEILKTNASNLSVKLNGEELTSIDGKYSGKLKLGANLIEIHAELNKSKKTLQYNVNYIDIYGEISSPKQLVNFLSEKYPSFKSDLYNIDFKYQVSENNNISNGYDYFINFNFDPYAFERAMNQHLSSIKHAATAKEDVARVRKEFNSFFETMAHDVLARVHGKKILAQTKRSWYSYPNLQIGYNYVIRYSWTNYEPINIGIEWPGPRPDDYFQVTNSLSSSYNQELSKKYKEDERTRSSFNSKYSRLKYYDFEITEFGWRSYLDESRFSKN